MSLFPVSNSEGELYMTTHNCLWMSGGDMSYQDMCLLVGELQKKGWQLKNIVLVHLYVRDMEDFGKVNAVYRAFFSHSPPARWSWFHVILKIVKQFITLYILLQDYLTNLSVILVPALPAGCVCRLGCPWVSSCRWMCCSMSGLWLLKKAASSRETRCTCRAFLIGRRLTSDPTARLWR